MASKFILATVLFMAAYNQGQAGWCPPLLPPSPCLPPALPPLGCSPLGLPPKTVIQKPPLTISLPLPPAIPLGNICTCRQITIAPALQAPPLAPAPCAPAPCALPPPAPLPTPCAPAALPVDSSVIVNSLLPLLPTLAAGAVPLAAPASCLLPPLLPPPAACPPAPCY